MVSDVATIIETWFADNADDGEFARYEPSAPFAVIGPAKPSARVLFATKPSLAANAIDATRVSPPLAMIGRYGLPDVSDVPWLRDLIGTRQVWFLGDMDPVDLLVFAWVREQLTASRVEYLGIGDAYLRDIDIAVPESFLVRCAPSEQQAIGLFERVLPDFRDLIGPTCARTLASGYKIELEAIVSAAGSPGRLLKNSRVGA